VPESEVPKTGNLHGEEDMAKSRRHYDELMLDRPEKFSPEDVDYRESDGKEKCAKCVHLFERFVDGFTTCEVMSPEDDSAIDMQNVCDFFTTDGTRFPLLK
jgi:hypothetical protein